MSERSAVDGGDATSDCDETVGGAGVVDVLPYLGIVALYLATVLGGLALTDEVASMGLIVFEDPGDVGNVGVFAAIVIGMTAVMVLAFRYEVGEELVRAFLLGSAGALTAVAFVVVTGVGSVVTDGMLLGFPSSPVSAGVALGTAIVLWVYPEWWLNDLAAVVFGAAAIPMLGLGFSPLPVVVLLVAWAGYDAYAVYVSGHMQELAAGLGDLRAPIVFIVPRSLSYSMRGSGVDLGLAEEREDADGADSSEPDAAAADERSDAGGVQLLGLGDALIPGMLAASASQYLDAPVLVGALNANAPALGALGGGLVGMAGLLYLVHRVEGAHAGLPPLNAGVLGGYLVGCVAAGIPLATALGL